MSKFRLNHSNPHDLANMATCALLALGIARKYKEVPYNNRVAANKFLGGWAHKAMKEVRFGLQWNDELDIWRVTGTNPTHVLIANLEKQLVAVLTLYAKKVETALKFPASFRRRLSNAGTILKSSGWDLHFGLERDWDNEGHFEPTEEHTAFILKEHMDEGFDKLGRVEKFISLFVISDNSQAIIDAFYECGILLEKVQEGKRADGKPQLHLRFHPNNTWDDMTVCEPSKAAA